MNLYTEHIKCKSFKEENLDLFPDSFDIETNRDVFLDPRTGLVIKQQNKIPTNISKTAVINSNDGWTKSWIRSIPNYANDDIKKRELEKREASLSKYIADISTKNIELLDNNYTYINLCNGTKYAYGHLLDLILKLMYLSPDIVNPCFLISDENGIKDIREIIKIASGLPVVSFKEIKPTDNVLYSVAEIIELKQVNGICNFSNLEEYNLFLNKFCNKFLNKNEQHQNVFLTRTFPLKRHIINFPELYQELIHNGIHVVTGNEPFIERAEILHNANKICGYHGALFVDTCFCKSEAQILEYVPVTRPAKCFLRMFKRCKNYYIKNIESTTDHNVILNIEEIINFYNS